MAAPTEKESTSPEEQDLWKERVSEVLVRRPIKQGKEFVEHAHGATAQRNTRAERIMTRIYQCRKESQRERTKILWWIMGCRHHDDRFYSEEKVLVFSHSADTRARAKSERTHQGLLPWVSVLMSMC